MKKKQEGLYQQHGSVTWVYAFTDGVVQRFTLVRHGERGMKLLAEYFRGANQTTGVYELSDSLSNLQKFCAGREGRRVRLGYASSGEVSSIEIDLPRGRLHQQLLALLVSEPKPLFYADDIVC